MRVYESHTPGEWNNWNSRLHAIRSYAKANGADGTPELWVRWHKLRDSIRRSLTSESYWKVGPAGREACRRAAAKLFPVGWSDDLDLPPDDIDVDYKPDPPPKERFEAAFKDVRPEQSLRSLAESAPVSDSKGLSRADMAWVYDNVDTDWRAIPSGSAPSRGAVAYLRWVKDEGRNEFYRTLPAKMLKDASSDSGEGASVAELDAIYDDFEGYLKRSGAISEALEGPKEDLV